MTQEQSITLYCTEGSSDKEYQVQLKQSGADYVVNIAYGRRGSALRTGTKTNSPVTYDKARAIYDKLVKTKMRDGYTEAQSGARYVGTDLEEHDSGLSPMLPSPISRAELEALINDDAYAFQEKYDGENRQLDINTDIMKAINRRGLFCSMREDWTPHERWINKGRTIIAGEDMGEHFVAFDIAQYHGIDITENDLYDRHATLYSTVKNVEWIVLAPLAKTAEQKRAMLEKVEKEGGEGIVAKRIEAPIVPGRSTHHLKMKFQESATFEVIEVNSQRSVRLGLYNDADDIEDLGNVTIPANHDIPEKGDLVEVQYMMRYENGALMQPVYKGKRDDLDEKPSTDQITRIKMKKAA